MLVLDAVRPIPLDAIGPKHGYPGVVRYVSPNTNEHPLKRLTTSEVTGYRLAQVAVAVVWETGKDRAVTGGTTGGRRDGASAHGVLAGLGMPADMPCYFAVDIDTTGPLVAAYFRALGDVLPVERIGAYGGIKVLSWLFDQGLITYGWQTSAWSSGRWDKRAQAQQYSYDVPVGGVLCDVSRTMADDWGQWNPNGSNEDRGLIMQVDSFAPAALAQLQEAVLSAKVQGRPAAEQADAGLSLGWATRGAYYRSGYVANTAVEAIEAALDHQAVTLGNLATLPGGSTEQLGALAAAWRAGADAIDKMVGPAPDPTPAP